MGCAGVLALAPLNCAIGNTCDTTLTAERPVYESSLEIRGQTPIIRTIATRSNANLIVFATKANVNVSLEIKDANGTVVGRADSPIRRTGVQRARLFSKAGATYDIVITGKDQGDSNGTVALRVIDINEVEPSVCLEAQKSLAAADAAYAEGQAVTRALTTASGNSSDRSYQAAAAAYQQAANTLEVAGESPLLAESQLAEASLLNIDVDSFTEAKHWAVRAAQTYGTLGDSYGKSRAQSIDGSATVDIAMQVKRSATLDAAKQASVMLSSARDELQSVVSFHSKRGEFYDSAWAENNIGLAFYYEGRYDEAIRAYKRSLSLYQKLGERRGQAQVLQNAALVEYELGRVSDSLPHFRQALTLIKRDENPKLYAAVLGNSALANWASGNQDQALNEYGESLAIARAIQDTSQQAVDLHNIASVYATLGDHTRALEYYGQSVALLKDSPNSRGHVASLRAMANIFRQQGHAGDALKMDQQALELASTPSAKTRIGVQMARDFIDLGRLREAAQTIDSVLSQNATSDEVDRARALCERARLRESSNDSIGAESDLKIALATFKTYELPSDQFEAWLSLARNFHRRGLTTQAFTAIDQALALAEEVRLQSANPELRSTLLQPLRPAFDLKILMLSEQYAEKGGSLEMQRTIALRALETAEQARARALADYQMLDVSAPGLDSKLLERRQALYKELAARRFRLEARLDRTGTTDSQSQAIRNEIAALRQELDQIDAKIGAASQFANSHRSASHRTNSFPFERIPNGVAVVEYWVGESDAFAWTLTNHRVRMYRVGDSARVNAAATALHTTLRSFGRVAESARLESGARLYGLLLSPLESDIEQARTLIFAPDGALHYVPFATLRTLKGDRSSFLIEDHDIAVIPSVQMFLNREAKRSVTTPTRQMLLVSDPVYDPTDPRLAKEAPSSSDLRAQSSGTALTLLRGGGPSRYLPRLPGAAREAAAISALMPLDRVDRLDGFSASREKFLTSGLERYRLIHVASHATTDPEVPQASALILSTVDGAGKEIDGQVLAADFMGVRLHADTVVLSACDTALGKSVAGEGLIGLQYVVLARGARSVISSLWPAIDQLTAELMVKFYSNLFQPNSTVISAWSAASRATLAGKYPDPGTWGAFMLTLSHVDDLNPR